MRNRLPNKTDGVVGSELNPAEMLESVIEKTLACMRFKTHDKDSSWSEAARCFKMIRGCGSSLETLCHAVSGAQAFV